MSSTDQAEVRGIIERWCAAISAEDRSGILAQHAQDVLMFDFPNEVEGIGAYDRTWDFFFRDKKGPISFVPRDIRVTAGSDIAFASCLIHCDGTSAGPVDLRLTTGLSKVQGGWLITHEHHSVPTEQDRLIDSES